MRIVFGIAVALAGLALARWRSPIVATNDRLARAMYGRLGERITAPWISRANVCFLVAFGGALAVVGACIASGVIAGR